jgi:hypothetical protein
MAVNSLLAPDHGKSYWREMIYRLADVAIRNMEGSSRLVELRELKDLLGEHPFDLDRAFGDPQADGTVLFTFPRPEPDRLGWDCNHDHLETRGCEAVREPAGRLWHWTFICGKHRDIDL